MKLKSAGTTVAKSSRQTSSYSYKVIMLHVIVDLLVSSAYHTDTWHIQLWRVAWLGTYTASNKHLASQKSLVICD